MWIIVGLRAQDLRIIWGVGIVGLLWGVGFRIRFKDMGRSLS